MTPPHSIGTGGLPTPYTCIEPAGATRMYIVKTIRNDLHAVVGVRSNSMEMTAPAQNQSMAIKSMKSIVSTT